MSIVTSALKMTMAMAITVDDGRGDDAAADDAVAAAAGNMRLSMMTLMLRTRMARAMVRVRCQLQVT